MKSHPVLPLTKVNNRPHEIIGDVYESDTINPKSVEDEPDDADASKSDEDATKPEKEQT